MNAPQILALDKMLTAVQRGGDVSVMLRSKQLASALQLLRNAKRRADLGMRLVNDTDQPVPAPSQPVQPLQLVTEAG